MNKEDIKEAIRKLRIRKDQTEIQIAYVIGPIINKFQEETGQVINAIDIEITANYKEGIVTDCNIKLTPL